MVGGGLLVRYRDVAGYYYNAFAKGSYKSGTTTSCHRSQLVYTLSFIRYGTAVLRIWRRKSAVKYSGSRVCLLACSRQEFYKMRTTLEDGERLTRREVNGASRDNVTTSGANARRFLASASAAQLVVCLLNRRRRTTTSLLFL